ncbi:MAG: phage/plasmid primase, P4 family [Pirellulales bacterium]
MIDAKTTREMFAFARASNQAKGIRDMLALARSELAITPDMMDRDPMLLNVQNGTIDLRTGKLREHRREDYITKVAPVEFDSAAGCPTWMEFIRTIFKGDQNLISFVRRALGYSLTGDVSEDALFICYGKGANGKTTLMNVVHGILGDYSLFASGDLLMVHRGDSHPTVLCDLFNRRAVFCVETGDGQRLNEALVKRLTGREPITARRMREDYWTFGPTHKLWLASNYRPSVRGTDHAIWRRINLVPFDATIPKHEQDEHLTEKLLAESSGILNWILCGLAEWRADGLGNSAAVEAATREYRDVNDLVSQFVEDTCEVDPNAKITVAQLYEHFKIWCEQNGERAMAKNRLSEILGVRFEGGKGSKGVRIWKGLGLKHVANEK